MTDEMTGIPHTPGTKVKEVTLVHPDSGEESTVYVPADHDGSRIRADFPEIKDEEGNVIQAEAVGWVDGFDPLARALENRVVTVECAQCCADQPLAPGGFTCSACGARNVVELRVASDSAEATESATT